MSLRIVAGDTHKKDGVELIPAYTTVSTDRHSSFLSNKIVELLNSHMGASLYLLLFIITIFIGVVILIARTNRAEDAYDDLETDEWDCPGCGFHVQAGDKCIYCGAKKRQ